MDNPLKNLFAVGDLRNRVLFTLGMLVVYRIGNQQLPELAAMANRRVTMSGTVKNGRLLVARVTALDAGETPARVR